MVNIEDLTGIPEEKRKIVITCLDDLLIFRESNGQLSPIIKGYNLYPELPQADKAVLFSNIHETEAYKLDMLRDLTGLGYIAGEVLKFIRGKVGVFIHDPEFRIRNDQGEILQGLKIRDIRTGEYLDLGKFATDLSDPKLESDIAYFIDEDVGWELNIPFNDKKELKKIIALFLRKSGASNYNKRGIKVSETEKEKKLRAPWSDAYGIPILIIGEKALKYRDLPLFTPATKISLKENNNEISFIINRNLERLRKIPQYAILTDLGFCEEKCLGNKPFIRYIDEKR